MLLKWKRVIPVVLSAAIIGSLVGCGNQEQQSQSSASGSSSQGSAAETSTAEKATISIMPNASWWLEPMEKVAAEIEAKTGVAVDVQKVPDGAEGQKILKTKLAANELPDLVCWAGGSFLTQLNPSNSLMPITDLPVASRLSDEVKDSMTYQGALYGVPLCSNGWGFEGILYSKKLFSELNLQIPTTYDQLMDVSRKIKDAGKIPIWMSFKDAWTTTQVPEDYWAWIAKKDPGFTKNIAANKLKLVDVPEYIEGLAFNNEIIKNKLCNEDYSTATYDAGLKALVDGTAGMYPQGAWAFGNLEANYPDQMDNVGFFAQPIDGNNVVAVSPPIGIFISKNTKNLDAVSKWLDSYATDGQKVYYAGSTGLPMFKDITPNLNGAYKDIVDNYFNKGNWAYNEQVGIPIMFPDWEPILQSVAAGETSPKDAAAQLDKGLASASKMIGWPGW